MPHSEDWKQRDTEILILGIIIGSLSMFILMSVWPTPFKEFITVLLETIRPFLPYVFRSETINLVSMLAAVIACYYAFQSAKTSTTTTRLDTAEKRLLDIQQILSRTGEIRKFALNQTQPHNVKHFFGKTRQKPLSLDEIGLELAAQINKQCRLHAGHFPSKIRPQFTGMFDAEKIFKVNLEKTKKERQIESFCSVDEMMEAISLSGEEIKDAIDSKETSLKDEEKRLISSRQELLLEN